MKNLLQMKTVLFFLLASFGLFGPATGAQLKAPIGVPVSLSGGVSVIFEQSGAVSFPNTNNRAAILMFIVQSGLGDIKTEINNPGYKQKLHDYTVEICKNFGDEHVKLVRNAHKTETFAYVAIQLKFLQSQLGGLDKFLNWTSIYNLDRDSCGERLKGSY